MSKALLKGNFQTKKQVHSKNAGPETLEEQFEKEAMKKLGGSICFVSKKKVLWPEDLDQD